MDLLWALGLGGAAAVWASHVFWPNKKCSACGGTGRWTSPTGHRLAGLRPVLGRRQHRPARPPDLGRAERAWSVMAGRWIADGPPGFVPGTGGFFGTPKGDMVEHDCKVPGKGGDSSRSWTCGPCGRPWRWSPGSGLVTWGESKAPKRRGLWG